MDDYDDKCVVIARKWGPNSIGVSIPKEAIKNLGLLPGDYIKLGIKRITPGKTNYYVFCKYCRNAILISRSNKSNLVKCPYCNKTMKINELEIYNGDIYSEDLKGGKK